MAGERLDLALVSRGLAESRSRARQLIEAGAVNVDGLPVLKPALRVSPERRLALAATASRWASRAALKLLHALDAFAITPEGRTCLDIGASTGGFTDVLLARGAASVHAVDVGHGQMLPRLCRDRRVHLHERLNVRDLGPQIIAEPVSLIVCDVSFIPLRLALPPALALGAPGALLVALIKPQFEVGRARIGKGGIVRDEAARRDAQEAIRRWLGEEAGWRVTGTVPSPVTGGDGNAEYLIAAQKPY